MAKIDKTLNIDAIWFQEQQSLLEVTNQQMGVILGCSLSHVEHMRSGRRQVTNQTKRIIRLLISGGLNGYSF